MGVGSKANHLTYLGDAEIGAGVNVGAGTITCNYDGVNKSTTTIEDNAFIGSNASLVAPVTIGKGATIGAGSVIGTDAPAGALTVPPARQVTIEGWQRPHKAEVRATPPTALRPPSASARPTAGDVGATHQRHCPHGATGTRVTPARGAGRRGSLP